jgi:flagellar FliJ protein
MPASPVETLQAVLTQKQSQRDAAQMALRAAEAAAARSDAQASQLQQYRGDFRQRWSAQFAREGDGSLLQCHHGFGQRLDQAIDQQQQQCRAVTQKVAQARAVLQQREVQLAAVRKLIDRRLAEQRRAADRLDQKRSDEAAQQAAWRQQSALDIDT